MDARALKQHALMAVERLAPPLYAAHQRWWLKGYTRAREAVVARYGTVVQSGPFAGTRLIDFPYSPIAAMIVGTFERELAPIIENIIARGYETVVNVGSAEGYYAVGLARRMPGAHVYGFEMDDRVRERCELAVRLNGVEDRVSLLGVADATGVASVLHGRSLIVCDCEGAERDVLQPEAAPALLDADLLVEAHDHKVPGVSRILRTRFAATHDIREIHPVRRRGRDHPEVRFLTPRACYYALLETRPVGLHWLYMTARRP
jgi:hypothetical protein